MPAIMGSHWLTRFDDDGEPYGEVCWCDIREDHLVSGEPNGAE